MRFISILLIIYVSVSTFALPIPLLLDRIANRINDRLNNNSLLGNNSVKSYSPGGGVIGLLGNTVGTINNIVGNIVGNTVDVLSNRNNAPAPAPAPAGNTLIVGNGNTLANNPSNNVIYTLGSPNEKTNNKNTKQNKPNKSNNTSKISNNQKQNSNTSTGSNNVANKPIGGRTSSTVEFDTSKITLERVDEDKDVPVIN